MHAQTIQGLLLSGATGEPVSGGEVALLDTLGGVVTTVQSDSGGAFALQVSAGRYAFRVRRLGYAPTLTEQLDVPQGAATIRVRIELVPADAVPTDQPYTLAPIIVEAQPVERYLAAFQRRRAEGLGDYVLRAEFEQWNPQDAGDVIRRMPGFVVRPNPSFGWLMPDGTADTRRLSYRDRNAITWHGRMSATALLGRRIPW